MTNKPGCLAFFMPGSKEEKKDYRYQLTDSLLTDTERDFYRYLLDSLPPGLVAFPKVNLGDIVRGAGPNAFASWSRINRKHLDFLLLDPKNWSPVLAVELDDPSHRRQSAQKRDRVKDSVLSEVGLPVLRVSAARRYDVEQLRSKILASIKQEPPTPIPGREW